jgi:flagellar hook-basal body complex protein FliE
MDYLKEALGTVDNLQKDAASSAERLALGDESYLHNTIIAYEKANLALQLTLEVRNRVLEAYQEIMRLQM